MNAPLPYIIHKSTPIYWVACLSFIKSSHSHSISHGEITMIYDHNIIIWRNNKVT